MGHHLKNPPVFFLDLQTTGSTPLNSHILEMAFGDNHEEIHSFLVEQPENTPIPRRIQMITGVKDEDMKVALPFKEAMKSLLRFVEEHSVEGVKPICVIHFAQFEKPFLTEAFKAISSDIPFKILCTHDIAKRLLPNLPTRGIKGLAGYLGFDAGELKRSPGHITATKIIWNELIKLLFEKEITTLAQLEQWIVETPKPSRSKYEYPLPKEKRLSLPNVPGIYRMLNFQGEVLYVGKATSLKSRVNSYFRGQKNRDHKKLEMLAQVYDLAVTPCETPLEAAMMETDEIKRLNPRYNISLKVGFRNLVFFDSEFLSTSHTPDEVHTTGPFSSTLTFEAMMALSLFARTNEAGHLPDAKTFFEEIDPSLIKEGFEIFSSRHNFTYEKLSSMRFIVATGIMWKKRQEKEELLLKQATLEEDSAMEEESSPILEEESQEEEINDLLTPEDIADKIERHITRIGGAYLRSRKMNRMLNVDVEFQMAKKKAKKLYMRNGKLATLEDSHIAKDNSWANHSIETYDRITVLLSELDRVKGQSGNYHITYL